MKRLVKLALTLPPHVVARRGLAMIGNRMTSAVLRRVDRKRNTRATDGVGPLRPLLPALPVAVVELHRAWVLAAAARFRRGVFDHLGSGWVRVGPGAPPVLPAPAWAESARLRTMISAAHAFIDWHVDFKSGHAWAADCWYKDIAIGHAPGVDVKVPWELGRLHHLTTLALAEALEPDAGWAGVFRDHVLDFLAANPPRFGVNWRCTMDVGIRAANLVLGWSLMQAAGARFDEDFTLAFSRSLLDHGRHIMANLEKYPEGRGNHYLANVCGLAFVARALPPTPECLGWEAFAKSELLAELDYQFLPDGANFEASTCYHRLSAEMAAFAAAVLAGGDAAFPPPGIAERLDAMARFTLGMTKPGGRIAQIGDNDSGRFFKLQPAYDAALAEDDLDHRHLLGCLGGLLGRDDLKAASGPFALDGWIARALAGRALGEAGAVPSRPWPRLDAFPEGGRRIELIPGGSGLLDGLECLAWPDFGYWLLRSSRLWLGIRCGAIGQHGRGGHAHNDQLAVELCLDGVEWIADPGTFVYTPHPAERDRYRSARAHFVPRRGEAEPGRLDLGLFWLGDEAKARCLHFGPEGFVGEHRGYGNPVTRVVLVEDDRVVIRDLGAEGEVLSVDGPERARNLLLPQAPSFSPGYGKRRG